MLAKPIYRIDFNTDGHPRRHSIARSSLLPLVWPQGCISIGKSIAMFQEARWSPNENF
jgi:hypothetical protein